MKKSSTSERLKQIMNERNLKQVDILEKAKPFCEKYGIDLGKSALSQYVSGKVDPGSEKLTILGLALNVNEVWLMGYDVSPERENMLVDAATILPGEELLLSDFRSLNPVGQNKAIDYVSDLADNPKYKLANEVQEEEAEYYIEAAAAHHKTGVYTDADRRDISKMNEIAKNINKARQK